MVSERLFGATECIFLHLVLASSFLFDQYFSKGVNLIVDPYKHYVKHIFHEI